jgi:hypothetical protein
MNLLALRAVPTRRAAWRGGLQGDYSTPRGLLPPTTALRHPCSGQDAGCVSGGAAGQDGLPSGAATLGVYDGGL